MLPPSIRYLGPDGVKRAVFDLALPQSGEVAVDVLDSRGGVVERILKGKMEAGCQHVVWKALVQPGVYTTRARGRGWEVAERILI